MKNENKKPAEGERVSKVIAACGVCSRRAAEELITAGRVRVNGAVAIIGQKVLATDDIVVDGVVISLAASKYDFVYIMLNKPVGVLSAAKGQFGRQCVTELVDTGKRLFPVGRLDLNTTGLILLTNDGALANKLTHPSHEVDKTYIARVENRPTEEALIKFRKGVEIDGAMTAPAAIEPLRGGGGRDIRVTIHEGRNRQVRKMLDAIGCLVISLKRIATGKLTLGNLEVGKWRKLTDREVEYLRRL